MDWEKIFANHIPDNGLTKNMNSDNSKAKKNNPILKNGQRASLVAQW